MAITGDNLVINLRYVFLGQECQTGQMYEPVGPGLGGINAAQIGEAWWNDVKAAWRGLAPTDATIVSFNSVLVEELNGSAGYGEYAIPLAEQTGLRGAIPLGNFLPSYTAVGVRLSVDTRVTRPGQKRFPFLTEGDVTGNQALAAFLLLVEAVALEYSSVLTLGAPAAATDLTPIVVKYDPVTLAELARQPITGHVINPMLTSQVSRRFGHGR